MVYSILRTEVFMERIIRFHGARYPLMQPLDFAKLVYQSAFGGGHLINDENTALENLRRELASLPESRQSDDILVPVGNGLSRLDIAQAARHGIRPETITAMFSMSANDFKPDVGLFDRGMTLIVNLNCCGKEDSEALLASCRENGYSPFSHSEIYRREYHPAYRIVDHRFIFLLNAIIIIEKQLLAKGHAVIAVEGRCASGKSTYASLLQRLYDAQLFHMDDYFLPFGQKTDQRLAMPGGNVDHERFRSEILDHLLDDVVVYRPYDCASGKLAGPVSSPRKKVQIIEGVYSMHPAMAFPYDVRLFFDIGHELQNARIMLRNPDKYKRFINEWIPLEEHYFASFPIRQSADAVLNAENQGERL